LTLGKDLNQPIEGKFILISKCLLSAYATQIKLC
jgi:hypothetical protein